jgi:hypothetical protein
MITKADLARSWSVSHQYISRLVARGMPLTGHQDASDWRKANASSKPSNHPKRIAQYLSDEKDDASPEARERRKAYFKHKPAGYRLHSENSLDGARANAIEAHEESFRLLKEAMIEGRDNKIGVRLAVFNKAQEGRFRAEQAYREEMERQKVLIPLAQAMDVARRGYGIILSRLRCLPQNVAPRCNPANPHLVMVILETECAEIIADARRVYEAEI